MLPWVAGARPSSARPSVVLPLPDSPTSPSTSPRCSDRFTPSTARTDPELSPISRDSEPPRSEKCTSRSLTSTSGVSELAARGWLSGFVCNGDLLPRQRLGLLLGEVLCVPVRQVGGPALGAAAVRHPSLHRVVGLADVHRVRAARVEVAARGRL